MDWWRMVEPGAVTRAMHRIERALRQEQRMQAGHAQMSEQRERRGFSGGWVPEWLQALENDFGDEVYFFIGGIAATSARVEQRDDS